MAAACSFNSYYSSSHVPCLCGHLIQNTAPASHGPECLLWFSPCRIILFLSQCSCLYRVPLDWFLSLTSSFCFSSWSQHCQDGSWCHHRVQNLLAGQVIPRTLSWPFIMVQVGRTTNRTSSSAVWVCSDCVMRFSSVDVPNIPGTPLSASHSSQRKQPGIHPTPSMYDFRVFLTVWWS